MGGNYMRSNMLCFLLITVLCIAVTPCFKSYPLTTRVDLVSGEVWKGRFDEDGRRHGLCIRLDRNGNLLEEIEFIHGVYVNCRRFASNGKLLIELGEDENYHLIQTFP